jgi:cysteinyl-tRNA synthetase
VALRVYNTATREKELFEPFDAKNVRFYVCGPTVYDFAHIGNARPVIVFDVLYRLLRLEYGADHVKYARNITDVDDKIINAAEEGGEAIDAVTGRTTRAFHEDMAALGALEPTVEPRATQHIPQMIAQIERLIEAGHAYAADGHVLFNVPSMADYGKLSGRNRKEQVAGARVEVAPYKKDPADFVLWKPSDEEQPGWESPWGRGRPGWHIECSAMSEAHLGVPFDIHGGGLDLVFPHHENEVAQSTCAHDGGEFVRYWMHNGFVIVEGEKMSKSLGNFLVVRDVLAGTPGEVVRMNMLGTHYRQPLDWTEDGVANAKMRLDRLYTALRHLGDVETAPATPQGDFLAALEDDLNTPKALAALDALATEANKASDGIEKARLKAAMIAAGGVLGILGHDPEAWRTDPKIHSVAVSIRATAHVTVEAKVIRAESSIKKLIAERDTARREKNFAEADRIRDQLAEDGVTLEDGPEGTTWRRTG